MVLFLTLLGVSYFAVTVAVRLCLPHDHQSRTQFPHFPQNLWTKTIYAMTADFPHGSFTKLDLAHLYQAAFIGSTAESFFAYRCWKVRFFLSLALRIQSDSLSTIFRRSRRISWFELCSPCSGPLWSHFGS